MQDTIVIALGGNAIIREGQRGIIEEQYENIEESSGYIADLVEEGYNIIITHGNGPQIGKRYCTNSTTRCLCSGNTGAVRLYDSKVLNKYFKKKKYT